MQVHNYGASQTLFAFNHWGTGGTTPCIGIGNCPSPVNGGVDWTFADNANDYTVRSLQVLVLRADSVPPVPVSAYAGSARTLVTVTFSEPLAATSVDYTRFTLDHGVTVQGATLLPDLVTVNLTTTGQPAGVPLTLTVNGIRDLSANLVPAGTTIAVSTPQGAMRVRMSLMSVSSGWPRSAANATTGTPAAKASITYSPNASP